MNKLVTLAAALFISLPAVAQMPTPSEVRQSIAKSITDLNIAPASVGAVENRFVPSGADSIAIRVYRPGQPDATRPIIYQIHGGAWVAGDLNTHDNICRRLCRDADAVVVAIDYRRPPEHPYPASNDDAMTVLTWIQVNRAGLSQTGPLILLGDSAGGAFVAGTCLRNAEAAKPIPIAAQILINPALDVRPGSVTFTTYEPFIRWGLPDITKASDPYISPLASSQLQTLPPTSIVVSEKDEIRDDGVQMDQKLRTAGVRSTLFEQKNSGHFAEFWCADHPVVNPALTFVLQQIAAAKP